MRVALQKSDLAMPQCIEMLKRQPDAMRVVKRDAGQRIFVYLASYGNRRERRSRLRQRVDKDQTLDATFRKDLQPLLDKGFVPVMTGNEVEVVVIDQQA